MSVSTTVIWEQAIIVALRLGLSVMNVLERTKIRPLTGRDR
jgi:hypothetical protein